MVTDAYWYAGWIIWDSWGWQVPSWRTSSGNCKAVGNIISIYCCFMSIVNDCFGAKAVPLVNVYLLTDS